MNAPQPGRCPACDSSSINDSPLIGKDMTENNDGEFAVYSCAECGSGITSPYVATENLGSLYEGMYDGYADPALPPGLGWTLEVYHRAGAAIYQADTPANSLDGSSGDLLEIGCGDGRVGESFIARGWRAHAIEPSPLAVEAARGRGIDVHHGTLDAYDDDGRRFDAILFRHSLEHVVEPRDDLAKVSGLLKPGGKLLVEVPNYGSWQVKRFKGLWYGLSLPLHRTHFTERGLRAAVTSAGFAIEKVNTGTCPASLPACVQYRLFGRNVLHRPGAAGVLLWRGAQLLTFPLSWAVDKLMGGGDVLRLVAVKPA